eukprot:SAG22_NODE_17_length_32684_cov_34.234095_11_plen_281_part_00
MWALASDARCTAKGAGASCVDDTTPSAVRCCADVVVVQGSDCDEVVAENLCALPGVTVTLGGEVETATNRPTTYSGSGRAGQGFRGGQATSVVDDTHEPSSWTDAPFGDCASCDEQLFLTVDLGTNYPVTGVTIWHYYGDTRAYCSQKVAVSQSGAFQGEEVVVYNTGTSYGEQETETGNTIVFERTVARFVRHWSSRSTSNTGVHFMEIDVIGAPADDRDRERSREIERDRERSREIESETETERDRERQRETDRDRERQRETERDRETDRVRDRAARS